MFGGEALRCFPLRSFPWKQGSSYIVYGREAPGEPRRHDARSTSVVGIGRAAQRLDNARKMS